MVHVIDKNEKYTKVRETKYEILGIGERIQFIKFVMVKKSNIDIELSYLIFNRNNEQYNRCTDHHYSLRDFLKFISCFEIQN